MRPISAMATLLLSVLPLAGQILRGPGVGEKVPDFQAIDQNGRQRTLSSALGPKGGLLVFYRSADW